MSTLMKRKRGRPKADVTMMQIAIRLPVDLIAEVDAIVDEIKADPLMRAERSAVIRALLHEALVQRKTTRRRRR
jgi:metal-responsive CopG/Arc/MetJ family transcriptional regulator